MADLENKDTAAADDKKPTAKKKDAPKAKKPSLGSKIAKFFRDYKSELKKVVWPGPKQVVNNTTVVVCTMVAMCLFIFALDTVFSFVIQLLAGIA